MRGMLFSSLSHMDESSESQVFGFITLQYEGDVGPFLLTDQLRSIQIVVYCILYMGIRGIKMKDWKGNVHTVKMLLVRRSKELKLVNVIYERIKPGPSCCIRLKDIRCKNRLLFD